MKKVKFEIDEKEYVIPQFMSVGNYMKFFKVKDLVNENFFAAKLVSELTGAPYDKVLEANRDELFFLINEIIKILPTDKPAFVDRFTLNGVEYGFIPEWKKMSFGEFVDLDTLMTKTPNEAIDYLHIITAILYRPIVSEKSKHKFKIEKYNSETLEERAELFKDKLDVEYAIGAQFFFTQFAKNYSNYTPISLKMWILISWMQIKFAWKYRKILWKFLLKRGSDGYSLSTEFRTMMLLDMTKLLEKELSKSSIN